MRKVVRLLGGLGLIALFVVGALVVSAGAMGGAAPQATGGPKTGLAEKVFLVDNFESGSLKSPREWWTFDIEKAEISANQDLIGGDASVEATVGTYSLLLSGMANNFYVGGCGTYLAKENQDTSKYTTFIVDVYGNGPGSGTLKVELVDDDNNNWQAEQDRQKQYALIYDDKYVTEVNIDWNGWKKVSIPLASFVDDNPGVGDDIWNPNQANGSGGLLQMQLICIATDAKGKVNYNLDNIALTMDE
ncbi:MAG: hypothetical protein PHH14_06640 [Candidatus Margulisbacteria bacterium]|nr:hypothetical protein [Candidatus Margulisiibacteriota bacterium]